MLWFDILNFRNIKHYLVFAKMCTSIRDAIFEHKMFKAWARGGRYGFENICLIESTWSFSRENLYAELMKMEHEGLIESEKVTDSDGNESDYWQATTKGLRLREKRWQKRGLRHPALIEQSSNISDLIIALIASTHGQTEGVEFDGFVEDTLPTYLIKFTEDEIKLAVESLFSEGKIRRLPSFAFPESHIDLTREGQIYFANSVIQSLGLVRPSTILAPIKSETPIFNDLELEPDYSDNLCYRWEEAERCIQSRAWLAASILFGSILEEILISALKSNYKLAVKSKKAPKRKSEVITKIQEWSLNSMIDVAADLNLIDGNIAKHGHVLRDTRNLVHPEKQIKERSIPNSSLVEISKLVVCGVVEALKKGK